MGEIRPELRLLTRTILDALITSENTKRAVTLTALREWDFEADMHELSCALDVLEKKRLIRKEMRGVNVWYELTHERLVKPILQWFQLDLTFTEFRFAREVIVNGARNEMFRKRPEALLTAETLDHVIRPFRDRLRLDSQQLEFAFWSAVYRRSKEINFWAGKLDAEKCRSILLTLMKGSDATSKVGAATAASFVADEVFLLARECLRLASTDPEVEVRRAAGISLSKLAGSAEVQQLRDYLSRRATRKAALEALADFETTSPIFKQFGWFSRWRAMRIGRRRIFDRNRGLLNLRTKVGALAGMGSGIIWALTISPLFISICIWNSGVAEYMPLLSSAKYSPVLAFSYPVCIIGGAILGAIVGRSTAKVGLQGKPFSWWKSGLVLLIVVLVGLAIFVAFESRDEWLPVMLVCTLIAVPACVLTTFHVRLGSAGVMDASASIVKRWGIGIFHATAPFLIGSIVGISVSKWKANYDGLVIALIAAYLSSGVLYVWSMSLVETELRGGESAQTNLRLYSRRFSLATSVGVVVCLLISYVLVFGARSIPIFAKRATVTPQGINFDAYPGGLHIAPNTVFFNVELNESAPHLYKLSKPSEDRLIIRFKNAVSTTVTYVPTGKFLGSVSSGNWKSGWRGSHISLQPILTSQSLSFLTPTSEWQYIFIPLRKDESEASPTWVGEFNPSVAAQDDHLSIEIAPLTQPLLWFGGQEGAPMGILTATASGMQRVLRGTENNSTSINSELGGTGELALPANAIFGQDPISLSAGDELRYRPLPVLWKTQVRAGVLAMNFRLTFQDAPTAQGYDAFRRKLSKDEISKFPSQLGVVLGFRRAGTPSN